ncbi:MAG: large repetitive protein, partial [Candidatus Poribacteria bacterium]|nr:large repetitive protein [Candidatus Poribacteria bacterium]
LPGKAGSYVSIPHDDILSLTTFSIMAWVNYGLTGSTQRIVIKGSATSNYSYYLSTRGGEVLSYTGFSTSGQAGWIETFGNTPVADKKWHHVAATYDKKSLRLYVDGKLESEVASSDKPFVTEDPLAIGAESDGNYSAVGSIDDVGVFNAGLSEDDINIIMSKGLGEATGMSSVFPAGKLTTVWGKIKVKTSL